MWYETVKRNDENRAATIFAKRARDVAKVNRGDKSMTGTEKTFCVCVCVCGVQGNMDLLFPFIVILNDIPEMYSKQRALTNSHTHSHTHTVTWCECEYVNVLTSENTIPSHCCSFIQVSLAHTLTHARGTPEHIAISDRRKSVSRHDLEWECETRYDLFTDDRVLQCRATAAPAAEAEAEAAK